MQSPPPYAGTGRKKSNVGLIIGLIVAGIALCCILPVGFMVKGGLSFWGNATGMIGCSSNMGALRQGLVTYAKKHNGMLPPAVSWKKDIQPFLTEPVLPPSMKPQPLSSGVCDINVPTYIVYNSDVAGKKLSALDSGEEPVVLFESPKNSDKADKYKALPYADSPKLVAGAPRGWIEQPLHGDAYLINQTGNHAPIGNVSMQKSSGVKVGN